jgi:heptosyltransferase-2
MSPFGPLWQGVLPNDPVFHAKSGRVAKLRRFRERARERIRNLSGVAVLLLLMPLLELLFRLAGKRTGDARETNFPRSILLIELTDIGDMALASAFWRELRARFPDAEITLLVQPSVLNLVENCPYVNDTLTFHYRTLPRWKTARAGSLRWWLMALQLAARELWPRNIDLAVSPRWDSDGVFAVSGILAFVSGAQRRVGFITSEVDQRTNRVSRAIGRLINEGAERPAVKHEVEFRFDVLRALGREPEETHLETWTDSADDVAAERLCGGSANGLLVAFAPGAAWDFRRWPAAKFAELGHWLQTERDARIVLIGGPPDRGLCGQIRDRLDSTRTIDGTGLLTLRETAAVLKRCGLFVGNDSGPLHIASAAGIPLSGCMDRVCISDSAPGALHPK